MSEPVQLFSDRPVDYARFRPRYPDTLFDWLADQCASRTCALDLAAGNGQASFALAERFTQVLACDASHAQLQAQHHWQAVLPVAADAEQLPVATGYLDLIVVAQALHWFATPAFFAEARRALRPGGLFCAWCYSLVRITPPVDAIVKRLHGTTLDGYWPEGRASVDAGYRDIHPPFPLIATPTFSMQARWQLADLIGYLRTWSAVKRWEQAHGHDPIDQIESDLRSAWGAAEEERTVSWPLHLLAGRPGR